MLKHLICLSLLFVAAICGCFDNGDKEIGGSCYKFVSQKLSFEDARDWCHYKNPVTPSYLAHVGNQFTANFLASYAKAAFGPSESFFWIGLSRNRSWTPWTWDTGYQAGFTNFGSDALSQNYAAEAISNTKWSTFGDDTKMFFVCSYDPTAPPTFGPPVTVGPTAAPTTTTPRVTTPTVPTTTVTWPACRQKFHGVIAVAFEMTKLAESGGVMDFIRQFLYESDNYQFADGTSQAINVPYPDSGVYENYILHYPDATSADQLEINIDQLYSECVDLTDAKIERAYEYILEERGPVNSTGTNVLITVGVDDMAVFDGSATSYLHQLQNKYGFRSLVVSIGGWSYLSHLAESDDWYFMVNSDNGQWVADQISRIICNL